MRRSILLILLAMVLALPFLTQVALRGGRSARAGAAVGERLVIVTPHNGDIRREFQYAFSAWHEQRYGTAVEIDYRTPGGTVDIRRMLDNMYRGYRDKGGKLPAEVAIDLHMVWGGGDFFFGEELKPLGILQPIRIDAELLKAAFPEVSLAGVKLYDEGVDGAGRPAPQWVGVCLSSFGIVYNADLYGVLKLAPPKQWADLANPKLSGLVALADPSHSGSASVAYMIVVQRAMADAEEGFLAANPSLKAVAKAELARNEGYQKAIAAGWKEGMKSLVLIAANARYLSDSSSMVPRDVGNGQAAAGMAIDFYGRVYEESVGPGRCKFVSPVAATAITPDPIAILHGVKGRPLELATHFIEFLLSREGQRLWIVKAGEAGGPRERALRRPPIRRDVYGDRRLWTDDVDLFADAGDFNQRSEWMVLFSDMRAMWMAAWIDSREALRSAYERVLKVKDERKRAALIERLSNLPIELNDVVELRKKRKEAEAAGRGDEFKASSRIQWARRFSRHYAKVAAAAGGPVRKKQREATK